MTGSANLEESCLPIAQPDRDCELTDIRWQTGLIPSECGCSDLVSALPASRLARASSGSIARRGRVFSVSRGPLRSVWRQASALTRRESAMYWSSRARASLRASRR